MQKWSLLFSVNQGKSKELLERYCSQLLSYNNAQTLPSEQEEVPRD